MGKAGLLRKRWAEKAALKPATLKWQLQKTGARDSPTCRRSNDESSASRQNQALFRAKTGTTKTIRADPKARESDTQSRRRLPAPMKLCVLARSTSRRRHW